MRDRHSWAWDRCHPFCQGTPHVKWRQRQTGDCSRGKKKALESLLLAILLLKIFMYHLSDQNQN